MIASVVVKESMRSGYSRLAGAGQWVRKSWGSILADTGPKNNITSLDGVRAIACLLVVGYHINLITRDTGVWNPGDLTHALLSALVLSGFSGVTLFFVLSGFLLFLPYARALLFNEKWPSARLFYLRRVLRIVPAYYITLILLLLFYDRSYVQPQHLGDIGLFFVFLMDSTKETYQQIEGPLWTLAVEWQFYMLLPLLALGMRWVTRRFKANWSGQVTIVCLCAMMAWGLFARYWGLELNLHPNELSFIPTPVLNVLLFLFYGSSGKYLEDFSVGMLLCLCYVYTQHPDGARLAAYLRQRSLWFWGIGILALVGMCWWHTHNAGDRWPIFPFMNTITYAYEWVREWLFSCSYSVCILAILFSPHLLQRFFSWKPLCSLGKISYSLYMWHLPFLVIFMTNVGFRLRGGNGFAIYPLYWLYLFLLIIPFCTLFYGLCEKPGIKLAARVRSRALPAPSSVEPEKVEIQVSEPPRQAAHVEV